MGASRPRELGTYAEILTRSGHDSICVWAAQGAAGGGRAWALGRAVAVLGPGLAQRNRIALTGDPDDAADLARRLLSPTDPLARIIGDGDLVAGIGKRWPELVVSEEFGWMETRCPRPRPGPVTTTKIATQVTASWLAAADESEIAELIDRDFPASSIRPGVAGVRRWAGARDQAGRLVAVAGEAWTAPGLGFLSGVVTRQACRGRGYGRAVCALAVADLLAEQGAAALLVDAWNTPAIRLYRRIGMIWRGIRSAKYSHPHRPQRT